MQKTVLHIDGKKLERASDKIFQEHFLEVCYNDFSPICAMVCVEHSENHTIDMRKVEDLQYYGFKTTHIQHQEAGIVFFVYQDQDNRGHEI